MEASPSGMSESVTGVVPRGKPLTETEAPVGSEVTETAAVEETSATSSCAGVPAVKSVANSDRYLNSTAQHTAKNKAVLLEAGIPEEQIAVTNLCTHCNPDILFSHRAQGDRRGNLSALLALKE